jgi:hypothetical protein
MKVGRLFYHAHSFPFPGPPKLPLFGPSLAATFWESLYSRCCGIVDTLSSCLCFTDEFPNGKLKSHLRLALEQAGLIVANLSLQIQPAAQNVHHINKQMLEEHGAESFR